MKTTEKFTPKTNTAPGTEKKNDSGRSANDNSKTPNSPAQRSGNKNGDDDSTRDKKH